MTVHDMLPRLREITLELAPRGCPGIATLLNPVAIHSSLQIQEVAASWRA